MITSYLFKQIQNILFNNIIVQYNISNKMILSSKKLLRLFLSLCLLILSSKSQAFTPSNYSVSPNYAKSSNSLYIFTFNAVTPFVMNFDFQIYFPSQYPITTVSGCKFWLNNNQVTTAVCSVNTTTNQVVFSSLQLSGNISSIKAQFNTSTARFSGSSTITFYFINITTNSIISSLTNYVQLSIVNAVMTCGISSTSNIVGDNTTYGITINPVVPIEASSVLQIQMQPWGPYSQSNFITTNTTAICSGQCSLTLPSSNGNISELLVYNSLFSTQTSSSSTITLSRARNPASTSSITVSVIILARITSLTTSAYMNCSSTFSVTNPNVFKAVNFATTNTSISASNIITLRLTLTNPVSSASYIRIQPSILSLTYQFNNYNQGTQPFQMTTTDGSILIGNLTTSTTSSPSILTLNNFTLFNPPYSNKPVTLTFSTENLIDGTFYLIDRSTSDIVSVPSAITETSVTVSNTSINAITTYNIVFRIINRLVSTSYIVVTFPSTINITGSTCSLAVFASSCVVNNSTTLTIDINTAISSSASLTLTVNSVRNPKTTTTTSSLSISSYYQDSASLVDSVSSGMTVTATSVPLKSVVLTPSSYTVGNVGNYTLSVQITNDLPSPSIMRIKIPSTSFANSTITLQSFTVAGTAVSTCSLTNLSPLYIQLEAGCFTSNIPALTTIRVILGNITNPFSTKPTNSWQIQTLYNSLQMQYITSGVTVTMTTPTQITSFSATPASQIVNTKTVYEMKFTFVYPHYSGDRVIINFPTSEVLLGPGFQCVSLTANISVSCSQSSNNLQVVLITSLTSGISNVTFTVSQITNNWYSSTSTLTIQTTTNDSTFYFVQSGQSTVNFLPTTLAISVLSNQQIILLGQSIVKVTITSPFALSRATNLSLLYLLVVVPTDLTPVSGTCTLSFASAACAMSGQRLNITNFGDFSSSLTITFNASTTYFVNTSVFTSQLYYSSSLIGSNSSVKLASYCTNPCKQCTSIQTQCLSCLPSPYTINNTYFSVNNTCVSVCPSKYYVTSGACAACNSSACNQCSGNANNCTSCNTNTYLYNSTCLVTCPSKFYASGGACVNCVSPCSTCTNSTFCLSCVTGYLLDIDNKCVPTCSNRSYIGINGTCQLCTDNCLTCSVTLSNCTSCTSQYSLFNNQCLRNCQTGYFNNSNSICQACPTECTTCQSLTSCQSCASTYYLFNQTVCTKNCPSGTLPVVNVCQTCDVTCATCSVTVGNCTSCPSHLLFYFNQCLQQCPPLFYEYNKTCTSCIAPCATCLSSPELCQTCIEGYYLFNVTCVTQCPTNGYYISGANCLPCTQNCLTCRSLSSCDLCSTGFYLLSGSCVSSCPDSHPIMQNRQCTGCSQQCATCMGTAKNCTSCTVYYFKYLYSCVLQCPLTYYSNIVTYQCEDGLSTRITFFPVLITAIVVIFLVGVSKCFVKETSFLTAVTALLSPLQLIIWIYVFSLLFATIKQPGIEYGIPIALLIVAILLFLALAIIFFFVNKKKMLEDDHVVQWSTNNVNYTVSIIIRFFSLVAGCKFFRIIYSRLFNTITLSLAYKNRSNAFTVATIFTVCCLVFVQVPAITACWFLIYKKTIKDQIFYSSIEAVILTAIAILFSLLDIYKPETYFQQSQFCRVKKYVQKIKDFSTMNKIQEGFQVSHDEGSVDAERFVGSSGGKLVYSKQKPQDIKDDVFFSEQKSQITDAMQKVAKKKKSKILNIFGPIKQQDAEDYQIQKYQLQQIKTQFKIQQQKKRTQSILSEQNYQQIGNKTERRQEMGIEADQQFDDNRSLINQRERKQKWNNIISKRKQLSDKIFNKHPPNLEQIDEPLMQDQQQFQNENQQSSAKIFGNQEQQISQNPNDVNNRTKSNMKKFSKKKKKVKVNKQLQQIYLQRLTQKKLKSAKDLFLASDKSIKYEKYDF